MMTLEDLKPSQCACNKCAGMCEIRICWPTPSEAQTLINKGFGDRLSVERYTRWDIHKEDLTDPVFIIAPSHKGNKNSSFWSSSEWGRCTFLTEDKKCELHDKGLKPIEGRLASCEGTAIELHDLIADTWRNSDAEELVLRFDEDFLSKRNPSFL